MRNINRKCSIFDFLLKKNFFFSVRASRHDQRIEWSGSPQRRTRMATTKQQKLLQLKKKNSSIFAFFKKIQLFMSVERKTILDVVAIKHRKRF